MSSRFSHPRTRKFRNRLIDYVLYVGITFSFLAIGFLIQNKWGHEAYIRWGGLAGFTAVLFGYFIADSKDYLRNLRLWFVVVTLFSFHVASWGGMLIKVDEWRLPWFSAMAFEYPLFLFLRNVAVDNV